MIERSEPGRAGSSAVASSRPRVVLALGESALGPWFAGHWILPLVTLGSRAARDAASLTDDQLVIALTLPVRKFAAALIGCGWTAATPIQTLGAAEDIARRLASGTPIRVITDQYVVTATFTALRDGAHGPVLWVGGQGWQMAHVRAIAPIPDGVQWVRTKNKIPLPGVLSALTQMGARWNEHLCVPPTDLALVGTAAWLWADLAASVGRDGQSDHALGDELRGILLPKTADAATWATRVYPTATFLEELDDERLPSELRAVVLDGASAVKCLADIEVPVVFAIIDRSIADESSSDAVLAVFRSRGKPLSFEQDFGWHPPAGVEALAFTVPL